MSRVDVIDLELTVLKADGLAAKDTNIFGKLSIAFYSLFVLSMRS